MNVKKAAAAIIVYCTMSNSILSHECTAVYRLNTHQTMDISYMVSLQDGEMRRRDHILIPGPLPAFCDHNYNNRNFNKLWTQVHSTLSQKHGLGVVVLFQCFFLLDLLLCGLLLRLRFLLLLGERERCL